MRPEIRYRVVLATILAIPVLVWTWLLVIQGSTRVACRVDLDALLRRLELEESGTQDPMTGRWEVYETLHRFGPPPTVCPVPPPPPDPERER